MGETTHCEGAMADTGPHQLENRSVSSFIATQVVVRMSARRSEHTCVNSVWNLAQWSVLVTQGGSHPKVRVRGSTRASGEFVLGCAPCHRCRTTAGHRCGVSEGGFGSF